MSYFYAEIEGSRGMASRCGTKNSGHWCHIRGWNSGVSVTAVYNETEDRDEFQIYVTGGSGDYSSRYVGIVHLDSQANNVVFVPAGGGE